MYFNLREERALDISARTTADCLIVRLRGEFDLHSVPQFRKKISEMMDKKGLKNLVLTLKEVDFIDSSGLGAILGRYRELEKKGGKVVLVSLSPQIRKLFKLSGLLQVMNDYNLERKALEDLHKGGS